MAVDLTETENENDSANQNDVAKMTLQNDVAALATQAGGIISPNKLLILSESAVSFIPLIEKELTDIEVTK